jgi:RNA polymerase sigma-70 factor (ECF subfamily)
MPQSTEDQSTAETNQKMHPPPQPPPTGQLPGGQRAGGQLSDEEVVARVLQGDLAAFELIMRRYNQRLFRIVRSIVGNDNEAEDVIQDTYVRAFEHLAQFAGLAKFSTWLTKIALNESLARRRRAGRMATVDLNDPENASMVPPTTSQGAEQTASIQELGMILSQSVDDLPDELRTVFAMRMIEGLDTEETANCLDLTPANVKVRLHRARTLLRDRIDARIGADVRQLYQFGGQRCDRIVSAVLARVAQL